MTTKPQKIEGGKKKPNTNPDWEFLNSDRKIETPHQTNCLCNDCLYFIKDKSGLHPKDLLELKAFQAYRVARAVKRKLDTQK